MEKRPAAFEILTYKKNKIKGGKKEFTRQVKYEVFI